MFQDDDPQDLHTEPNQSSLPSIRQLFGIRASDNLDALAPHHQRPSRTNNPPPSSFPHQAVHAAARTSPRPSRERRPEVRTPVRSASFSSGQVDHQSTTATTTTRGRLASPRSTSSSSIAPPYSSSSRSPTVSRARQSPTSAESTIALPPISTAIPGFIPAANRGRAVSDTEAFTRGGLASSLSTSATAASGPGLYASRSREPAPIHPSLHRGDPISMIDNREQQRGHVGRSPVSTSSYAPSSRRSHAHSIVSQSSSAHSDDPSAPSHAWTSARSSIEYAQTSTSSHEYAPHPYSSASIAARQNAAASAGGHTAAVAINNSNPSSSAPAPTSATSATFTPSTTPYASEGGGSGSTHASPSRADRERVPPSSFPLYGVYSSGGRPRSGNSSEGDESKGGFGKYECEYCSKRFNRPSSLRIHINTHTGAKPFQCPFPSCGRRFSVMSNMRRHARTHGNMLALPSGEDPHHTRGDGSEAGGGSGPSGTSSSLPNGVHAPRHRYDAAGQSIKTDADADMDVDELEGDDEDEMDYDGGAGSSESDGYSRRIGRRRQSADDASNHFHF